MSLPSLSSLITWFKDLWLVKQTPHSRKSPKTWKYSTTELNLSNLKFQFSEDNPYMIFCSNLKYTLKHMHKTLSHLPAKAPSLDFGLNVSTIWFLLTISASFPNCSRWCHSGDLLCRQRNMIDAVKSSRPKCFNFCVSLKKSTSNL